MASQTPGPSETSALTKSARTKRRSCLPKRFRHLSTARAARKVRETAPGRGVGDHLVGSKSCGCITHYVSNVSTLLVRQLVVSRSAFNI